MASASAFTSSVSTQEGAPAGPSAEPRVQPLPSFSVAQPRGLLFNRVQGLRPPLRPVLARVPSCFVTGWDRWAQRSKRAGGAALSQELCPGPSSRPESWTGRRALGDCGPAAPGLCRAHPAGEAVSALGSTLRFLSVPGPSWHPPLRAGGACVSEDARLGVLQGFHSVSVLTL